MTPSSLTGKGVDGVRSKTYSTAYLERSMELLASLAKGTVKRIRNFTHIRRVLREIAAISESGLFDRDWYITQNPDVARSVRKSDLDPLGHYVQYGAWEGRNPNFAFDSAWYLSQNPELHKTGINPLEHYIRVGQFDGIQPHPAFDEQLYRQANSDVVESIFHGHFFSGFHHFIRHGWKEIIAGDRFRRLCVRVGDQFFDFDEYSYVADQPDVRALIEAKAYRSGLGHFLAIGYREITAGLREFYSPNRHVKLLSKMEGDVRPGGQHACIFAHYDRDGMIDDYIVDYLKALRAQDADIFFVSAIDDRRELAKIRPYVSTFFVKNEAGRDFGSWYIILKELEPSYFDKYDYLFFVNDSVYFPVARPEPMFSEMVRLHHNMWGITDSKESGAYHLQSYLLAFDAVARARILPHFIRKYETHPHLLKIGQIVEYEIGLTQLAIDQGLSVGAYCSVDDLRDDVLYDEELAQWRDVLRPGVEHVNPTHYLWDLLIKRYNCPALKIELLRDNPLKLSKIDGWRRIIHPEGVSAAVIEGHLARLKRSTPRAADLLQFQPRDTGKERMALVTRIEGEGFRPARRLILFVHYDPQGIIDDHVVGQVSALRRCDSSVVFITGSNTRHLERIRHLSACVLITNNVGRDFGAWRLAVSVLSEKAKDYDNVVWMNDSTYFPLYDPADMFRAMDTRQLDFWGVVDSYLERWHIVSWFWVFGRQIISDGWFEWYQNENLDSFSKWDLIRNCEMRYPGVFKRQGYKVGTYIAVDECFKYMDSLSKEQRTVRNLRKDASAMIDHWDLMISRFKCPALKVELLLRNPLRRDITRIFEVLQRETEYDVALIKGHLRRLKPVSVQSPNMLQAILSLDGGAFVMAVYKSALRRAPTRREFSAHLASINGAASKFNLLHDLISSSGYPPLENIGNNLSGRASDPAAETKSSLMPGRIEEGDISCPLQARSSDVLEKG